MKVGKRKRGRESKFFLDCSLQVKIDRIMCVYFAVRRIRPFTFTKIELRYMCMHIKAYFTLRISHSCRQNSYLVANKYTSNHV